MPISRYIVVAVVICSLACSRLPARLCVESQRAPNGGQRPSESREGMMRGKGVVFLIVSHTAENAAPVFRILALAPARRNRQRRCHLPSLLLSVGSDSSTTFHRRAVESDPA